MRNIAEKSLELKKINSTGEPLIPIETYATVSQQSFDLPVIKKDFLEELYSLGLPDLSLKFIKAQKDMPYLGMYRRYSQLRTGPAVQLNIPKHFYNQESQYLKYHELTVNNLDHQDLKDIAKNTKEYIRETLWHEYGHVIYEALKQQNQDIQANETINQGDILFYADEEELVETFALTICAQNPKEFDKVKPLGKNEFYRPSDFTNESHRKEIELRFFKKFIETYQQLYFFPEDVQNCKNIQDKKSFNQFVAKFIVEGTPTFPMDNGYDLKVHKTYLKNSIKVCEQLFKTPVEIVYINKDEKAYPVLQIGDLENKPELIYLDLIKNSTNKYTYDDVVDKLVEAPTMKQIKKTI